MRVNRRLYRYLFDGLGYGELWGLYWNLIQSRFYFHYQLYDLQTWTLNE